ncbi:hypothetical protein IQ16_02441 [Bradyrhizobium huanghuaihaiense]|uniref:Uncharacterized protein n=1 Tax=Bradyrhizobium huanghuaihaiense TaxID=990078 RepID=A0A562RUY3_9BRAD|nr:hypothetical protein IQ16_02441 [Bradyrhizobium huanghuaihaiense]
MIRIACAALAALLLGCSASKAQVATTGSTAMDLPTVPGAIVTSPLNSPGPFSAATVQGAPDTTLAPVPLALNPTTPGTVVVCAPPSTSPTPVPATPTVSSTGLAASGSLALIAPPIGQNTSSIGTVSAAAPAGTAAATACSSMPGGTVVSAASLPLSIADVPAGPSPGTIPQAITDAGGTGIDPNAAVAPSPNASACAEGMTMNLTSPAMMLPANATGAAPTPGVSPVLPPGC